MNNRTTIEVVEVKDVADPVIPNDGHYDRTGEEVFAIGSHVEAEAAHAERDRKLSDQWKAPPPSPLKKRKKGFVT